MPKAQKAPKAPKAPKDSTNWNQLRQTYTENWLQNRSSHHRVWVRGSDKEDTKSQEEETVFASKEARLSIKEAFSGYTKKELNWISSCELILKNYQNDIDIIEKQINLQKKIRYVSESISHQQDKLFCQAQSDIQYQIDEVKHQISTQKIRLTNLSFMQTAFEDNEMQLDVENRERFLEILNDKNLKERNRDFLQLMAYFLQEDAKEGEFSKPTWKAFLAFENRFYDLFQLKDYVETMKENKDQSLLHNHQSRLALLKMSGADIAVLLLQEKEAAQRKRYV